MSAPRFIALAIAATLSACATPSHDMTPGNVADARTPTELWKAQVTSQPEEIRLAAHAQGISRAQADALAAFVDGWREADGGQILLQAPTGEPDGGASFRAAERARSFLLDMGVRPEQLRLVGYNPEGSGPAPLIVGYLRHTVAPLACGQEWTNISHSATNEVQPNFGCAVTANMAAQIANPADLAGPRTLTAADAQRRAVVLEKYRAGEITSSAKDQQAAGAVSSVVQ
jgi:pilus assembly protein CpaD